VEKHLFYGIKFEFKLVLSSYILEDW
jgi:hypothetical protein